ncbi:hypothetical protein AAZX31_20G015800 [Glycine max]
MERCILGVFIMDFGFGVINYSVVPKFGCIFCRTIAMHIN